MASVLLRATLLLLLNEAGACFEESGIETSECASDDDDTDVAFLAQLRVRRQSELSKDSPSKIAVDACEFEASESATTLKATTTTSSRRWDMLVEGSGNFCLDYNFKTGNAYGHACHGEDNQRWHLDDQQRLVVTYGVLTGLCLEVEPDQNLITPNSHVVVKLCTDSPFQKWTYHPESRNFKCPSLDFRTPLSQCLDFDGEGSYSKNDVYMHDCLYNSTIFKSNQQWTIYNNVCPNCICDNM
ncbi:unnamed protein product [Polarella glacialis]|uniref:Ricin B lectin domain-containing protein n=1 Tax=Polarella glacialis TaxID=89957 RepID=A0A813K089_POLGL|nr:unnamed protein product [Polarella glacialis]